VTDDLGLLARNATACGPVIYSLVNNATGQDAPSFIKLDNQKIKVAPDNLDQVGLY
jgi:hypothetical protein